MLGNELNKLQATIQWAQYQADIDVLQLAREHHDHLLNRVSTLPAAQQGQAYQAIDSLLPMEWPLWMEAIRYADNGCTQPMTLH